MIKVLVIRILNCTRLDFGSTNCAPQCSYTCFDFLESSVNNRIPVQPLYTAMRTPLGPSGTGRFLRSSHGIYPLYLVLVLHICHSDLDLNICLLIPRSNTTKGLKHVQGGRQVLFFILFLTLL